MSEKQLNIYQRILGVMSDATSVSKDSTIKIGNGGYKAVSHDSVAKLLHPLMVKHGLVCIPTVLEHNFTNSGKVNVSNVKVKITLINATNPTEVIESISYGDAMDSQDKGFGKAYSYAVKYGMLKIFMLESKDGDEDRVNNGDSVAMHQGKASVKQTEYLNTLIQNNAISVSPKAKTILLGITSENASKTIKMLMEGEVPQWLKN